MARPGSGELTRTPAARRFNCWTVSEAVASRLGNNALRATRVCPCACRMSCERAAVPRLKSRPRCIASVKESGPENGDFEMPSTLPVKDPVAWTEVLSVLTLAVVAATGTCTEVTPPFNCVWPESGSWLTMEPCVGAAGGPVCAAEGRVASTATPTVPANRRRCDLNVFMNALIPLRAVFAEAKHAEKQQHYRNGSQCNKIRPECLHVATLQHAGPCYHTKVMYRV